MTTKKRVLTTCSRSCRTTDDVVHRRHRQ